MPHSLIKIISLIFTTALIARVTALYVVPEPHLPYNAIFAYLKGAEMLVDGDGFADISFPVYTPPLYSLIIAMTSILFENEMAAIKVFQIVGDCITSVLIFVSIRKIFDDLTGIVAAFMWCLYPFAIYSTLYIGTEVFFHTFYNGLCSADDFCHSD